MGSEVCGKKFVLSTENDYFTLTCNLTVSRLGHKNHYDENWGLWWRPRPSLHHSKQGVGPGGKK